MRTNSNQAVKKANQQRKSGKVTQAESTCKKILKRSPQNVHALKLLAQIYIDREKFSDAEGCLVRAASIDPLDATSFAILGECRVVLGKHAQALRPLNRALKIQPNMPIALYQLGNCHFAQGDFLLAAEAYQNALKGLPNSINTLGNLGAALCKLDRWDEAIVCYQRALELNPTDPETQYKIGNLHFRQGRWADAEAYYQETLKRLPKDTEVLINMGKVLMNQNRYEEACPYFTDALRQKPDAAEAMANLAYSQSQMGLLADPLKNFRRAIKLDSDNPTTYLNMAKHLVRYQRLDLALSCYEISRKLNPPNIDALAGMVTVYDLQGEIDKAWDLLQQLKDHLHKSANLSIAYARAALSKKAHEQAIEVLNVHITPTASPANLSRLLNMRAQHYDKLKRHEEAFGDFKESNDLRLLKFDPEEHHQLTNRIIETFDKTFFENAPRASLPSKRLIFIVGMPRSGTSLTEQILDSHPDVFGAGELDFLTHISTGLPKATGFEGEFPEYVKRVSTHQLNQGAAFYHQKIAEIDSTAAKVTDKMPGNYLYLGTLAMMFPEATIIRLNRNPIDTCLSCYFQHFGAGLPYASQLEHLGLYYQDYQRLMEHWHSVLPIPILDVNYEDLVDDTESNVRRLLKHIDLPWNANCLNHQKNKRVVLTASNTQVTQPIYRSSVGRAESYAPYLDALHEALIRQR